MPIIVWLQWGRDRAVAEFPILRTHRTRLVPRFNGAATARSRNYDVPRDSYGVEGASMEPRPRGRGIILTLKAIPHNRRLQWSRDRAVAELKLFLPGMWTEQLASMEPRPRGRGIKDTGHVTDKENDASMEPRPRGRGINADMIAHVNNLRASMEPRPRGRGIQICQIYRH